MKKLFWILPLVVVVLAVVLGLAWVRRASVAADLIQRHLGAPVSIGSLEFKNPGAVISTFWVGNPRGFKSDSAFTANEIDIDTTWSKLRGNPLIIDEIDLSTVVVTIENSPNGTSNWDKMLSTKKKKPSSSGRHWLIRKLTVSNLTVEVVNTDGSVKRYPPLEYMEFYNISDESGFPVNEIEKAIFNKMMQQLFQQLNLPKKLLQPFLPSGGSGILPIPNLFGK